MLNSNWITENHLDFEYKKYLLLAYLQHVEAHFKSKKMYPVMSNLEQHYNAITELHHSFDELNKQFPKELYSIDLKNLKNVYRPTVQLAQIPLHIQDLISFSKPKFENYMNEGRALVDHICEAMELSPIGIEPLYKDEGYLLLKHQFERKTNVYRYSLSIYETNKDYRSIQTEYYTSFESSISNTYSNMKRELTKSNKELPNPAVYVVESKIPLYEQATFLPIAGESLVKYITTK